MTRVAHAAALVALVLAAPRVAAAQELIPEDPTRQIEHPLDRGSMAPPSEHGEPVGHRLSLELGVYDGRLANGDFVFALLGQVSAHLVVAPMWQVDVALPFAFSYRDVPLVDLSGTPTGGSAGDSEVRTGNPWAAVAFEPPPGAGFRTRISLGVAAPATQLGDPMRGGFDALLAGLESNAAASRWLWMPSALSFVLLATAEHDIGESAVLGGMAAGGVAFCVDSVWCAHPPVFAGSRRSVDAPLEALFFVAAKLRDDGESRVGLRLRVAAMPTAPTESTQFSLEPYVHARLGRFFADGRFVMSLDDPYGFAFDRRGAWGIFVGAGVID